MLAPPIKATLVWTDIKGVANNSLNNNTPKLVNDLDLKISSGNSVVETWNLNPANPSEAAKRGNNKIDNVVEESSRLQIRAQDQQHVFTSCKTNEGIFKEI